MMHKPILLFFFLVSIAPCLKGQESLPHHETEQQQIRLALASLNSYVPTLKGNERMVIPAWGLEFEYFVGGQWAIAANFELELLTYLVEAEKEETISREYPFIASLLLIREFSEGLVFSAGYGKEFEPRKNFDLFITTLAYKIPLLKGWDLSPGFTYNNRIDAYDSWSMNIAFGKSF